MWTLYSKWDAVTSYFFFYLNARSHHYLNLPVQFKPTTAGRHTGLLLIQSETSGSLVIQLTGDAVPWLLHPPPPTPHPCTPLTRLTLAGCSWSRVAEKRTLRNPPGINQASDFKPPSHCAENNRRRVQDCLPSRQRLPPDGTQMSLSGRVTVPKPAISVWMGNN